MDDRDAELLGHAVRVSRKSRNEKWPLGALVVSASDEVLGVGTNSPHCGVGGPPWTEHAEEAAILQALDERGSRALRGSSVYVARTSPRTGRPLLARPCENCAALLRRVGVRRAVWTGVTGELVAGMV